jgi:hypothetical protein
VLAETVGIGSDPETGLPLFNVPTISLSTGKLISGIAGFLE